MILISPDKKKENLTIFWGYGYMFPLINKYSYSSSVDAVDAQKENFSFLLKSDKLNNFYLQLPCKTSSIFILQ